MRGLFCVVPFTPSICGHSRNLSFRLGSGSNGFHYRHGNGSKGAALPGATVTATSQERGQTYTALTNDSGLYRIAQLPVGGYTVKVEKKRIRCWPPIRHLCLL